MLIDPPPGEIKELSDLVGKSSDDQKLHSLLIWWIAVYVYFLPGGRYEKVQISHQIGELIGDKLLAAKVCYDNKNYAADGYVQISDLNQTEDLIWYHMGPFQIAGNNPKYFS